MWDGQSGVPLAVLEGHTAWIRGALALSDGRLLSWSADNTLRLWDGQSGAPLEVVPEDQVARQHPEWLHARAKAEASARVFRDFFVVPLARMAHLRHRDVSPLLAAWNADSVVGARCLLADGTVVVGQDNGQVCILHLHHGQRRISLAEAEALLASPRKKGPEALH